MNKDVAGGLVLLAIAAGYYAAIGDIPTSSLSDDVSPQGLPTVLAIGLAIAAVAIMMRGLFTVVRPVRAAHAPAEAEDDGGDERYEAGFVRALGVIACGALYVVSAWLVGYVPAIAILILAMALYEGMRLTWQTCAVAIGGAVFFWVVFVRLLGVAQPAGILLGG